MTSSPEHVIVVAHWQTSAGSFNEVIALVNELRQRSLEEPGCVGYEVLKSLNEADTIVLIESYEHTAALDAHRGMRHYRELLIERILPMLTARRVELFRPSEASR